MQIQFSPQFGVKLSRKGIRKLSAVDHPIEVTKITETDPKFIPKTEMGNAVGVIPAGGAGFRSKKIDGKTFTFMKVNSELYIVTIEREKKRPVSFDIIPATNGYYFSNGLASYYTTIRQFMRTVKKDDVDSGF